MKFLVFVLLFFSIFNTAFAYSESTTHPGLTDEIVDLFNLYYPELKISDEEKELAKKGSTDEDDNIRMMHHFYDPVYNRGIELAGTKWQSSKEWAEDTMGQASLLDQAFAGSLSSYFSSNADHSWNRAVYEYAWGDKKRSITDLGHILHLIEDASVPDHTRNDPHPPWFSFGSPYEAWTAQFDAEKLEGLAKSLFDLGRKPAVLSSLQEYFNSMAGYSNNNFFSKDTIFHEKYSEPSVDFEVSTKLSDGKNYIFQYKILGNDYHKLVARSADSDWFKTTKNDKPTFFIDDNDDLIISDYWSRLSKQAILHGAGVVKLFFDEVEKEKESMVLFNKNKSWFAKAYDAAKGKIYGVAAIFSSLSAKDLAELNHVESADHVASHEKPADHVASHEKPAGLVASNITTPDPSSMRRGDNVEVEGEDGGQNGNENGENGTENSPFALTKGEGGEGVRGRQGGIGGSGEDVQPPWFPKGGGGFSSPGFGGGGSVSDISNSSPSPLEGEGDGGGEVAADAESSGEPVDTTAPEISFSISECSQSLSADGCLVANSNLSILWSSASSDVVSYDIECALSGNQCSGFSFSSVTSTSTTYSLPTDEKNYEFKARARDSTGNVSNWSTISVEYYSMPVVINEIAWAGTSASSADEWIELKNRTGKSISLSGWTFYAQDLVPYLNLSGNISANGYYLIERTDDNTVSDVSADLVTVFSGIGSGSGLSNTGEVLILSHSTSSGQATTTIDQTPALNACGLNIWCGGTASPTYESMERIDPDVVGTDTSNWATMNDLATKNGKDADNSQLYATPKRRNSLNYLISQTNALSVSKTLTKSQSPYIVPNSQRFSVAVGTTLTVEPGVVIKMGSLSLFTVSGNILSSGTANDFIIFTSIYDDSYEGDTNGDGSASAPQAGDWLYLRIQSPSADSQINYTRFKYGGGHIAGIDISGTAQTMVSVDGVATTISNSIFEESKLRGLWTTNFNGAISGNTFSVGTTTTDQVGLFVYGGTPTITGNTFSQNYIGARIETSTATTTISQSSFSENYIGLLAAYSGVALDTLSFTNNTAYGIQSSNSTFSVSNPSSIIFSGNGATTSPLGLF